MQTSMILEAREVVGAPHGSSLMGGDPLRRRTLSTPVARHLKTFVARAAMHRSSFGTAAFCAQLAAAEQRPLRL